MAAVAKHARDDARADREYEQRKIEAAQAEGNLPEADGQQLGPPADPGHAGGPMAAWSAPRANKSYPAGTAEPLIAAITLKSLRKLNSTWRPWRRSAASARRGRAVDTAP